MKTTLITALSLMMAGAAITHAQTLTFDSQASFNDHFRIHAGSLTYSSSKGGLLPPGTVQTALATLGNGGYDPGTFLTEPVSMTFSVAAFGINSSLGIYTRTDDSQPYSLMTGVLGLVNLETATRVKLRILSGAVHSGGTAFVDLTFNLSTALTTTQKFVLTLEQQNIAVGDDLQAQFRLSLTDESGSAIYADTNWKNVAGLNNYIDEGAIGMRVYQNPVTAGLVVHGFGPVPAPIPEPSTMVLLGAGLAFGVWMRRRQTVRGA